MGYDIYCRESRVVLSKENEQACREAVALHYDLPVVGKELEELVSEIPLETDLIHGKGGEVIFSYFDNVEYDNLIEFLRVLAPYVQDGSHVDYFDDYGNICHLVVINGLVEEWEAKIIFAPREGKTLHAPQPSSTEDMEPCQ